MIKCLNGCLQGLQKRKAQEAEWRKDFNQQERKSRWEPSFICPCCCTIHCHALSLFCARLHVPVCFNHLLLLSRTQFHYEQRFIAALLECLHPKMRACSGWALHICTTGRSWLCCRYVEQGKAEKFKRQRQEARPSFEMPS